LLRQWRFHHRPVNALPSPGDAFKFVVFGKPELPQGFKDTSLLPFQEACMDCAGTALALSRERLPLAACA